MSNGWIWLLAILGVGVIWLLFMTGPSAVRYWKISHM
jgi:hypothetical protein